MSRRSPSLVEILVQLPWWVSAALGVAATATAEHFRRALKDGTTFNTKFAEGLWWMPVVVAGLFGLTAVGSIFLRRRKARLVDQEDSLESLRALSWREFESLVGEAYRRQGFDVDQALTTGPDGGVDLVLTRNGRRTIVQCKQWRTMAVGAPIVREVYGVMMHEQADAAIIITSGHFTRDAIAFAQGKPMELIDGPALLTLVQGVQANRPPRPTSAETMPRSVLCPKCNAPMIERTARRGANAGNRFWGCSTYPKCTGTRSGMTQ